MDTRYEQCIKVRASNTDFDAKVGLVESVALFQDNMCDYYKNINCDGVRLIHTSQAFWALTKTKIRFLDSVIWGDNIRISTDIYKLSPIRLCLYSDIVSNKTRMECIQEMCGMDSVTRKCRLIKTIPDWPSDVEVKDNASDIEFTKLDFDIDESYSCSKVIAKSNGVDMFGHVNNVSYVRYILGVLEIEFLKKINYKEFEIHYIKESREHDELCIYYKVLDREINFVIVCNDNLITKAKLKFEYREMTENT